jgi:polar amino acid transport system ATP-binding protein
VLKVRNVKKRYGKIKVLKDVSFNIEKGEVVALIGPSGSGKSTMLRCLNQLEYIDSGEISINDKFMVKTDPVSGKVIYAPKAELLDLSLRFGMVFQSFNLFPHMSVIENITIAPISVKKISKDEAYEIARQLLKKIGISEKENAYPCELSGGQQQRVAIARALALNPEIMFFDEPTSALDPELTGEVLKVIKSLAQQNMTMLIVTHEMAFARDVADRIIFIDDGTIIADTVPEEIFSDNAGDRIKAFLRKFD